MAVASMRQLLEAGVHFGHQTRRWNPKMREFIFTERNGIHIIDLQQTVHLLQDAYDYSRELAEQGKTILFVGTKKQAQEAVAEEARALRHVLREPALAWRHAHQLLDHSAAPAAHDRSGEPDARTASLTRRTKREGLKIQEEITKLNRILGGVKGMTSACPMPCSSSTPRKSGWRSRRLRAWRFR